MKKRILAISLVATMLLLTGCFAGVKGKVVGKNYVRAYTNATLSWFTLNEDETVDVFVENVEDKKFVRSEYKGTYVIKGKNLTIDYEGKSFSAAIEEKGKKIIFSGGDEFIMFEDRSETGISEIRKNNVNSAIRRASENPIENQKELAEANELFEALSEEEKEDISLSGELEIANIKLQEWEDFKGLVDSYGIPQWR